MINLYYGGIHIESLNTGLKKINYAYERYYKSLDFLCNC